MATNNSCEIVADTYSAAVQLLTPFFGRHRTISAFSSLGERALKLLETGDFSSYRLVYVFVKAQSPARARAFEMGLSRNFGGPAK